MPTCEASLCIEAAERLQWPKLYSVGRPRSDGHMPSLVGDDIANASSAGLVLHCCTQDISIVAVCGTEL